MLLLSTNYTWYYTHTDTAQCKTRWYLRHFETPLISSTSSRTSKGREQATVAVILRKEVAAAAAAAGAIAVVVREGDK